MESASAQASVHESIFYAMKYRRRFLMLALTLVCALALVNIQARDKRDSNATTRLPFDPAEELVYEGEFSRSLLRGLNIAEFRFTASHAPQQDVAAQSRANVLSEPGNLRFTMEAVSKGLFPKLFGVRFRQRIESVVEPLTFSVLQTSKLDEQGDRQRTSEAVFNKTENKVVWTELDPKNPARPPRTVTSDTGALAIQDIASAFYFLRMQELTVGKSFEINISDSGHIYRIPVRVVETKKMKTVLGEVITVRVDPEIFGEGRLIADDGKMSVWFTDDARRIPVLVRLSSDIGKFDIKLKSVSNGATNKNVTKKRRS